MGSNHTGGVSGSTLGDMPFSLFPVSLMSRHRSSALSMTDLLSITHGKTVSQNEKQRATRSVAIITSAVSLTAKDFHFEIRLLSNGKRLPLEFELLFSSLSVLIHSIIEF